MSDIQIFENEDYFEGSDLQRSPEEVDLIKAFRAKVDETDETVKSKTKVVEAVCAEEPEDPRLTSKANRSKRLKDKVLRDKLYKRGRSGKTTGVTMPVCELKKIQRNMDRKEYMERVIRGEFISPFEANQYRGEYRRYNSKPREVRASEKVRLKKEPVHSPEQEVTPPYPDVREVRDLVADAIEPYFQVVKVCIGGKDFDLVLCCQAKK